MTETAGRIFARVAPDVKRRLDLHATLTGQTLAEALEACLSEHLPTDDQLAELIKNGATDVSTA
jgi:hypothetical protein